MAGSGVVILGLVGVGALGALAWAVYNKDDERPMGTSEKALEEWGFNNNTTVMVPIDHTVSPRAFGSASKAVWLYGPSEAPVSLIYFPLTDSMHVNIEGYPVDELATQSWRTFAAGDDARNATTEFKLSSKLANAVAPVNPPVINWQPKGNWNV